MMRGWPGQPGGCFNPLHCGAVVASGAPSAEYCRCHSCFNPLHCGAVVASAPAPAPRRARRRFNPLHCGAVVASAPGRGAGPHPHEFQSPSLRGSGRFVNALRKALPALERFNPLHCGAVVASRRLNGQAARAPRVSIPFIAGQWSLLPRTTPSSLFGVLLRKRRLPCDHIICTRLPF